MHQEHTLFINKDIADIAHNNNTNQYEKIESLEIQILERLQLWNQTHQRCYKRLSHQRTHSISLIDETLQKKYILSTDSNY